MHIDIHIKTALISYTHPVDFMWKILIPAGIPCEIKSAYSKKVQQIQWFPVSTNLSTYSHRYPHFTLYKLFMNIVIHIMWITLSRICPKVTFEIWKNLYYNVTYEILRGFIQKG